MGNYSKLLQANFGGLIGLIVMLLAYLYHVDRFVGHWTIFILTIVSLYIFCFAFEYQRITLILARCVKSKVATEVSISDIQAWLSSPMLGFIFLLESIVFGIISGYLLSINIIYLVIVLFIKYIVLAWIPVPLPFGVLFRLINRELITLTQPSIFLGNMMLILQLKHIYKEMPHDKTYEDWAFKEYGNNIL
ncbi:hypothetical protein CO058_02085 [candidate division WWE3 bacterium CG_4_9_14_0_2_um_filter_35_11]|uniref:Uncharacterized protein n=1 Tax=candidate division WWE3 bacterium CG_4_9_14_0_2_um_filter_35_11 TaxID=1975077 RepID=A0A2M8ELU2_UNCKA|nr:MAG: hypothetical protein COV25_04285 [candidate division WWE3 bacterium CG10_big_fil_rev_8_21_14_0_10_35_32]PJC23701.1 MAG: hypothetical protein CO058_02085 [candidate division WWE3 bacterium CG_4_9_14_0_2_um_filter_35_11]